MNDHMDQTQFMSEEPLYEKPVAIPKPEPQPTTPLPTSAKWTKKKLLIVGALSSFIVLLLVIVLVAVMAKPEVTQLDEDEPMTAEEEEAIGPFLQQLRELDGQLQAADPTQEDLPFPPVDMKIRLVDDRN